VRPSPSEKQATIMRIAIVAFVMVLQSVGGNAVAQVNEARALAEQIVRQYVELQSRVAQLRESPADPGPRVRDLVAQRTKLNESIAGLQSRLQALGSSPNREAARGALEADRIIKQAQVQARANYAQQMIQTFANNLADGNDTAAAARLTDAAQQDKQIQEALERVVTRLAAAAVNAKNSPVDEPPPVRKPGIEKMLTLPDSALPKMSLEGVVVASDSGAAMPGVTVSLSRSGRWAEIIAEIEGRSTPSPITPVTTDAAGRFSFRELLADNYTLNVIREGYELQAGPNVGSDGSGLSIKMENGADINDLEVRLARRSNVSGYVRSLNGQGARGVPVQLLLPSPRNAGAPFKVVAETRSGERGEYRLEDIPTGSYILAAGAAIAVAPLTETLNGGEGDYGYTFYPGTSSAEFATRLVLAGKEVNADFTLSLERRRRIRGRVVERGLPEWPTSVTATLRSITPTGIQRGDPSADNALVRYEPRDGTFEASDLLPGTYTISMRARSGTPGQAREIGGSITVTVGDFDVDGELIELAEELSK
jgi:hypothetical protein